MLTPRSMVSTVPKKNLVITLSYLGRLLLQIRTRIKQVMKNKLTYFNRSFFFSLSAVLVTSLHLKTEFHRPCILELFINVSTVATMLPIMANLKVVLRSECVNTREILTITGKNVKDDDDFVIQ